VPAEFPVDDIVLSPSGSKPCQKNLITFLMKFYDTKKKKRDVMAIIS
jgi:hypothetical protein